MAGRGRRDKASLPTVPPQWFRHTAGPPLLSPPLCSVNCAGTRLPAAAGGTLDVEALLAEAGFIRRCGDVCYEIPAGVQPRNSSFAASCLHSLLPGVQEAANMNIRASPSAQQYCRPKPEATGRDAALAVPRAVLPWASMCIYGSALWRLIPQSPLPAPGHVRGQRVPAKFFADPKLLSLGGWVGEDGGNSVGVMDAVPCLLAAVCTACCCCWQRCRPDSLPAAAAATAAADAAMLLILPSMATQPRLSPPALTGPSPAAVVGELETASSGFTAAVTQLCNVATLPGIASTCCTHVALAGQWRRPSRRQPLPQRLRFHSLHPKFTCEA